METIIFIIVALVVGAAVSLISKSYANDENRKRNAALEEYLATLTSFEINADDILIDGLHWDEHVPVDVYDNKIDPDGYVDSTGYSQVNKYHKDKRVTQFTSTCYLKFTYQGVDYKIRKTLPIEHTTVRMKLYMAEKVRIYVDAAPDAYTFIADFSFLADETDTLVIKEHFAKS